MKKIYKLEKALLNANPDRVSYTAIASTMDRIGVSISGLQKNYSRMNDRQKESASNVMRIVGFYEHREEFGAKGFDNKYRAVIEHMKTQYDRNMVYRKEQVEARESAIAKKKRAQLFLRERKEVQKKKVHDNISQLESVILNSDSDKTNTNVINYHLNAAGMTIHDIQKMYGGLSADKKKSATNIMQVAGFYEHREDCGEDAFNARYKTIIENIRNKKKKAVSNNYLSEQKNFLKAHPYLKDPVSTRPIVVQQHRSRVHIGYRKAPSMLDMIVDKVKNWFKPVLGFGYQPSYA